MSGKKSVTVIAIGILLAASLIFGVSVLQQQGLLPKLTTTSGITSALTSSSAMSSSNSVTKPSGSGTLVLQIHDPPHVPPGVTAVFVTFQDIWIGSSNGGWIDLKQTGTINLMSVVNFTQTIANVKLQSGIFDRLMMNITSVKVTWNSANYPASVPSSVLTIPIVGSLMVSNSSTTGSVIDISPTIIEHATYSSTGSETPSFVMVPAANAYVVPSTQLGESETQVGNREEVGNDTWLTTQINELDHQTSFAVISSSLSNSSFFMVVKNTGNRSVFIQSVFIASNTSQQATGEVEDGSLNIGRSVLFAVLSNGTLSPYGTVSEDNRLGSVGYNLSAHAQVVFSYLGQIPPIRFAVSDGSDATTATTSTSYSGTETETAYSTSSVSLETSETTSNSYGFGIVPGQSYIVGATSGDVTSTLLVVAT